MGYTSLSLFLDKRSERIARDSCHCTGLLLLLLVFNQYYRCTPRLYVGFRLLLFFYFLFFYSSLLRLFFIIFTCTWHLPVQSFASRLVVYYRVGLKTFFLTFFFTSLWLLPCNIVALLLFFSSCFSQDSPSKARALNTEFAIFHCVRVCDLLQLLCVEIHIVQA